LEKEEIKMEKKLTIQAVSGAIRTTKGINVSRKYSSGKLFRSTGVYAEQERFSDRIVMGYWSTHNLSNNAEELARAIETLKNKGFKITEFQVPAFYGSTVLETKYQVELA
jgi:hypothetical protein